MGLAILAMQSSGCGYSNKSLLPNSIKSVYIAPVQNAINLSQEISDKDRFKVYRPGIEIDLTNAIINRFIFEGNLKVTKREASQAILETKLIDYRRDPLRYSDGDDIQEYRLSVVVDVSLSELATGKVIWRESNLTGDTTFLISGPRAISEDQAASKAVEDLARRVIEKTIEVW